jgi:lipopolysaccharide transport system permease protein
MLGYFWSLLKPLILFITLYVVFSFFVRFDIEYYMLYLLLGILMWSFLTESTMIGMVSLLQKASLIKKINFPKRVVIEASSLTSTLTFALNLVVFSLFFAFSGATLKATALLFPLYIVELWVLTMGLSFGLSALYLKFRDLNHIWELLLQIGFWITPIIYPLSIVPSKFHPLIFLNPMARIINDSRNALIYHSMPSLRHHIISIVFVLAVFAIGYGIFKKMEKKFAEEL